jgi:hypothetical protein
MNPEESTICHPQTPTTRTKIRQTLRAYWNSPEGRARAEAQREMYRQLRLATREQAAREARAS